jgi:hypothetical protein
MIRALVFLCLALTALAGPPLPRRAPLVSYSEPDLREDLAFTGARRITLGASIRLTRDLTLAPDVELVPGVYGLVQGGEATVRLDGPLTAGRYQIFYGFRPGQIRGRFGGEPVKPEWWGLEPRRHDRAINAAIQAHTPWIHGVDVTLANFTYEVSAPCDLRGTLSTLTGAGVNMTGLRATDEWDASTYEDNTAWPEINGGRRNHTAMVWLGSKSPASIQSHGTGISGVHLNCQSAAFNPQGRISGVAWDWAEEGSFVKRCYISKASGFGIGCAARTPDVIAMSTHMKIDECWIMGATFRDYRPVHFTQQCMASVSSTTIDARFYKEESAEYAPYVRPAHILQPPQYGISARGLLTLDNIHIEACEHGVAILQGSGPSQVALRNVSFLHGISKGMTWHGDNREPAAWTDTAFDPSAAVLICQDPGWGAPQLNAKDTVIIESLRASNADRLVTDCTFNAILPTTGYGQFPGYRGGQLALWARGTPYGPNGSGFWTESAPLIDRPYTLGPIR